MKFKLHLKFPTIYPRPSQVPKWQVIMRLGAQENIFNEPALTEKLNLIPKKAIGLMFTLPLVGSVKLNLSVLRCLSAELTKSV